MVACGSKCVATRSLPANTQTIQTSPGRPATVCGVKRNTCVAVASGRRHSPFPQGIRTQGESLGAIRGGLIPLAKRCNVSSRSTKLIVRAVEINDRGEFTDEYAVPADQRPVNELKALRDSDMYAWASLEQGDFTIRILVLYAVFFGLFGAPVASFSFPISEQPIEFLLSASAGSAVVVAVALLRAYLGWTYVGERLESAVVEYEESGWYDGEIYVKSSEVLARDRLLVSYQVEPALAKLKNSLVVCGLATGLSSLGLSIVLRADVDQAPAITSSQYQYRGDDEEDGEDVDMDAAQGRLEKCKDKYFLATAKDCDQFRL